MHKLLFMPCAAKKPEVGHDIRWQPNATEMLFSLLCGSLILLCVRFRLFPQLGGNYWQKVRDLSRPVLRRWIEWLPSSVPFVQDYFGAESRQQLLFVPDADTEPDVEHEISEPALFRFLLNEETLKQLDAAEDKMPEMLDVLKDIDKQSNIAEFETHQSSIGKTTDWKKAFHVFIVFKTTSETDGNYWWSLEKNRDYIVLQRSRNKENVRDKCYDEPRYKVKSIVENLVGKGTIKDLFALLWAQQMIVEKYHILNSNCQSFVTFVSQQMTEIGYEYQGFFKRSPPPENDRKTEMLDLINILRGSAEWPPLFTLIKMENIYLVDKMINSGKYDINASYNGLTPLHFAIMFSKTKMVQHLLKHPINADPTTRESKSGWNALHVATLFTMKTEIFELLLADNKVEVDDVDRNGKTALHLAAYRSNDIAVQKLIENGAHPKTFDKNGLSPLYVAAQQRDGSPIIDLLLEAQKAKGMGDVNDPNERGETALHYAALAANEITAEHLIRKGADANRRDKYGFTPLHHAAYLAENMEIIDLLLANIDDTDDMSLYRNNQGLYENARRNIYRLEVEISARFLEKGLKPTSGPTETDECSLEIDDILTERQFDINRCIDQDGETPLLSAIRANNVNKVRRLLAEGADPTRRNNHGVTPLHAAVANLTDCEILHLLVESGKVDIDESTPQRRFTSLHMAIATSNATAARFLLSNGANPNAANEDGITPLHMAAFISKDFLELFLNHPDVDVNCLDNAGRNALDFARQNKHGLGERIALLNEKGAVANENERKRSANNEIMKKHMRAHSNRKPRESEDFFSDETIPIEDKIAELPENYLFSAIRDSNVDSVRLLLRIEKEDKKLDKNKQRDITTRGEMGENALHLASFYAKTTDLIDLILETGKFDINGTNNSGHTPLHCAIMGPECETNARHLIQKGADPNFADKKGNTPLHWAARYAKEIEKINLILENKKVDINHINKEGRTALHYAMSAKNVNNIRRLLKNGADPTVRDIEGNTPFHMSAGLLTDSDVLGLMLENDKKIEIDERNKNGRTALHLAVVKSSATTVGFLLKKGANPNAADENGLAPLHLAATCAKDMDIVELLLNHKDVDVNCLDNEGRNALDYAKRNMFGHGERIAKLLKDKGLVSQTANSLNDEKVENEATFEDMVKEALQMAFVDSDKLGMAQSLIDYTEVDITNLTWGEKGSNALHMASKRANTTKIFFFILETGKFDINGCDVNGEAPLHYAINAKNMKTARCLLKNGADPTISDKNGVTPLHLAACHATTTDIVGLILKDDLVDINSRDISGMTALHYAIMASNTTTAHYLLEHGANPTVCDIEGNTPFHMSAGKLTDSNILGLMLENDKKIEIDERSKNGRTALHMAIATSNVTAARFLLSKGANPNVADENGLTPLHLAADFAEDVHIVELLLNHPDVDVNYIDNKANNALDYAMNNKHGHGEAIANLLREKAAVKAEGSNHEPNNIAILVSAGCIEEDSDNVVF